MSSTLQQEEERPFLILDAEDRVAGVGPAAEAVYGPFLGHTVWDRFPDARRLFRPHYERVRRTGEPTEFVQFYRGQVSAVRVVPRAELGAGWLSVSWDVLYVLDTLTLDSLERSMAHAIELLEGWGASARRRRARERLRLIEGGTGT